MTCPEEKGPIWPGAAASPEKPPRARPQRAKPPEAAPTEQARALSGVTETLKGLDKEAVARVLRWAAEAHGLSQPHAEAGSMRESLDFPEPGALLAAAKPSGNADRALLAGFWHQVVRGETDFDAFSVNRALKDHGGRLANVTKTLASLSDRGLVLELRKSGKARQARKRYRLTASGVEHAKRLF